MLKKEDWRASIAELRNLRSLCGGAMFIALNTVLNQFKIILSQSLQISASFLAIAACGYCYGPLLTGLACMAADILKYMLLPDGPFNLLWTAVAFVPGLIYGCVLYRRPVTLWRTALAKGLVTLIVNLGLNPLCLAVLYGSSFWAMLMVRLVKNLLLLVPEIAVLYALLKILEKYRTQFLHSQ